MLGVAIQDFAWLDAKMFADRFGIDACEEDACEEQHASDRHHGRLIANGRHAAARKKRLGRFWQSRVLAAGVVAFCAVRTALVQ